MNSHVQLGTRLGRAAQLSALGAAGLALFALLTWVLGQWPIGAFGRGYVPMAPSTAVLMLLLSGTLCVHSRRPAGPVTTALGSCAAVVVALFSLTVLLQPVTGIELPVERWLAGGIEATVEGIPVGRMSLVTAFMFLLAGTAMVAELPPLGRRRWGPHLAATLGLSVSLAGFVMILGYIIGDPFLYGTYFIPMALVTAAAFLLLGVGLQSAAGVETWPLQMIVGDSPLGSQTPSRRFGWDLLALLLCVNGVIGAVGLLYLQRTHAAAHQQVEDELEATANLKIGQIVAWRNERLADASFFFNIASVADRVQEYLTNPARERARLDILSWFSVLEKSDRYERIVLLDPQLHARLSLQPATETVGPLSLQVARQAMQAREIRFSDLYRESASSSIYIEVAVPILLRVPPSSADTAFVFPVASGVPPVGIILFRINPHQYLYPLIQSWPTPSLTAETLLVRRDGDEVLFLNELRHRTGTALSLRRPITEHRLPAVMGARGKVGVLEGVDYRGVPVIATVRAVPDTPWFMVAKMDQEEAFAPLRVRARNVGVAMAMFTVAACLGIVLLWKRRDTHLLRRQLQAEHERLALIQHVEHLMKSANDIILLADHDWRIVEANDRAVEIYGYSRNDLLQMTLPDLRTPEARANFAEQTRQMIAQGRGVFQTQHQRKDGSTFPIEVSERDAEIGGTLFKLSIIRDITERKRAEESLRESQKRLRDLIDGLGPSMFVGLMTPDGTVIEANWPALAAAGLKPEDVLGKPFEETYWWAYSEEVKQQLRAAIARAAHGETSRYDVQIRAAQGQFIIIDFSLQPLWDETGKVVFLVPSGNVITERKRAEEEIHKLNTELEQRVVERTAELQAANQELDAFSYSVSHDLRAPLRAISGFSRILLDKHAPELTPDAQHYLRRVNENSTRMGGLIDDLLAFSRLGRRSLKTESVSVGHLVREVLAELSQEQAGRQIDLRIGELPPCQADPALLRQLFVNLLANALKFTRRRAVAIIEIGCLGSEKSPEQVYFVKDNGVGFDMRYAEKLFGVFERMHNTDEYEGTGVGLAIVRRIIQRHGGRVWAEAEVDKGATFYFTLREEATADVKKLSGNSAGRG